MVGIKSLSDGVFGALQSVMSTNRFFDGHHPRDPAVSKLFNLGMQTAAGVNVTHDSGMAIPAVFRGVNIISNAISRMPFYVFTVDENEGKTYAKRHTSWKSVAIDPHPEIKMMDFRRTMTAWALWWGNAVAYIHRPKWPNGGPVEFTPLLPDRTRPVRITEKFAKDYDVHENLIGLLYYQTRINNEEVYLSASDCFHIRGLGPNPYWGWDIVELLVQAIAGSQARSEFAHRFYGQGANPAGFIEVPTGLDEESEKRFADSIKRGFEGMGKAHRIMLLEEGATFKQWTIDPQKAQFIEGMEFDYRIIANIIGIKVHKLIDSANNSYNSLEQANSEHLDDDLLPWINQWTGEYNKKLLTDRQRMEMSHVIAVDDVYMEGFVPFKERVEGVVMAKNNDLITRDEGRVRLNWGPSDSNGRRYTIPMNIEFTDDKLSLAQLAKLKGDMAPPRNLPSPEDDTDPDNSPEDDDTSDDDEEASIEIAEVERVWQYDCREGARGNVYLDGELVTRAVACDTVAGVVLFQEVDEHGNAKMDADGKEIAFAEKTGRVTFVSEAILKSLEEDAIAESRKIKEIADEANLQAEQMKSAWIQNAEARIRIKLAKTAKSLCESDKKEFLKWLDSAATETAPAPVQKQIDQIYRKYKKRLLGLLLIHNSDTISGAVAAEVNSWSKADEPS